MASSAVISFSLLNNVLIYIYHRSVICFDLLLLLDWHKAGSQRILAVPFEG